MEESNIEDLLVETGWLFKPYVVVIIIEQHGYISYFMKLCHGKKNNLVPPIHLDDLFKFIGYTGLNSEKRFLAFQSILYDKEFSEYVKNLCKVQESDNHMAKKHSKYHEYGLKLYL